MNWTDDQKKLSEELSCREMINSCLVYGYGVAGFWAECEWRWGDKSYAAPYVRSLGLERVKEIVAEQEADFREATVTSAHIQTAKEFSTTLLSGQMNKWR